MISMRTKQELILQYYRDGFSKRKISRKLGIHRQTVERYIRLYEEAKKLLSQETEEGLSFVEGLLCSPKYDGSKRPKRKLTQEAGVALDEYIKQNQEKRSGGLRKQVMKKTPGDIGGKRVKKERRDKTDTNEDAPTQTKDEQVEEAGCPPARKTNGAEQRRRNKAAV